MFFSVLIASVMLAVGISIFALTLKQFQLSAASRHSHFAFYTADTASECALYHDFKNSAFATNSPAGQIECNDQTTPIEIVSSGPDCGAADVYCRGFTLSFSPGCARTVVQKEKISGVWRTRIEARGYNKGYDAGNNDCTLSHREKVERAVRVRY